MPAIRRRDVGVTRKVRAVVLMTINIAGSTADGDDCKIMLPLDASNELLLATKTSCDVEYRSK